MVGCVEDARAKSCAERGVPRPTGNCAAKPTVMVESASELIRFMDWEITFRFGDWECDFGRTKLTLPLMKYFVYPV